MYESFYGFREKPFNTLPDPDFLYMSKKHEMALTYLEYGLSAQAGFMVLTGEIGSGKTTLINYLLREFDRQTTKVAMIFNTNIAPVELMEGLLKEWSVDFRNLNKAELYDVLSMFLLQEYESSHSVVLIIDEAQNLPFETLEEVRMISNINDEKSPLLNIILSGQPNLKSKLNDPRLEQLRQRITVHYHLDPLDHDETAEYIATRLQKAGATDTAVFTPGAIDTIFSCSDGIPRIINLVCDLSLVYGYAEQKKPVDDAIVSMVIEDRRKMGLSLGAEGRFLDSIDNGSPASSKDTLFKLEKRYRALSDNVYELALIIRKMLKLKNYVDLQQRDIRQIKNKLSELEQKFSGSVYQEMFQNIIKEWENAQEDKNKH